MAHYQRRSCGCVNNRNWRPSEVKWQNNCSGCPGGVKPSQRHHSDIYSGHVLGPHSDYPYGTASNGVIVTDNMTTDSRWGLSWLVIAVAGFLLGTFIITFIIAWQLGHVDPILPFIGDTSANHPEAGVYGQLLNISAVLMAILMYVRYRQVAEYVSTPDSPHSSRLNKAALAIGLAAAFGISLLANFPYKSGVTFTAVMHTIGGLMAFGLACVYMWLHVILTHITRPHLSSSLVCWTRLILAFFAGIMFIFYTIATQSSLFYKTEWNRAGAAVQWALMTLIVLFALTHFNEFRSITIKLESNVVDRKISNHG